MVLTGGQGVIEVRRGDDWQVATPGQELALDDAVRTTADGSAMLSVGGAAVELGAGSEVSIRELTAELARLQLEHGRLAAEMPDESLVVKVQSAGSSAVAEARKGRFAVFNDGRGLVAVASSAGDVRLSSEGGDVLLAAGERGSVVADSAPKKDEVPKAVLLKVSWPEQTLPRPREVVVRGRVEASTTVTINGTAVAVARDGEFETTVTAQRGSNPISITARDLLGKTATKKGSIKVSPGPPSATADTDGIWK